MAKQLNVEELAEQLYGLEQKIRAELVRDILADLKDFLDDPKVTEAKDLQMAIDIIKTNYA